MKQTSKRKTLACKKTITLHHDIHLMTNSIPQDRRQQFASQSKANSPNTLISQPYKMSLSSKQKTSLNDNWIKANSPFCILKQLKKVTRQRGNKVIQDETKQISPKYVNRKKQASGLAPFLTMLITSSILTTSLILLTESAATSTSTALPALPATNQNDLHSKLNEFSHYSPTLPPHYVKLGSNTSSSVRSSHRLVQNFVHLMAPSAVSNQTLSSDNFISQQQSVAFNTKRAFEKVCIGTSNRLSGQTNKTDHYQNLVERYQNCTHVIGNLEITWLMKDPTDKKPFDLSFLDSITEITGYLLIAYVQSETIRLPNLSIIRGREVFKMNNKHKKEFAMLLIENELTYLELPNLREIIYGHVGFINNRNLCLMNSIDWSEILNQDFGPHYVEDKRKPRTCPECRNCSSCWSPGSDMCQQFSKVICSAQCDKGRCYGTGPRECCHLMCAGGCTGPKQTDCFACKNFDNDGECVPECPPMNKYNPTKFLWEPDPNGKHAYGASCVKECPDHLLRDNGACVKACPPDKKSQNGECVPCAGPCEKNCQGVDVVNSKNIDLLVNCTEIEGSITILETSFTGYTEVHQNNTMGFKYEPMHPSKLNVLKTVVNITGFLNIQASHPDFKNLSFLSKLETIDGRQTTDMFHSLSIIKTSLVSLNLRSLKRVRSGKIRIEENKSLCYTNETQFIDSNIAKKGDVSIKNNGNSDECHATGLICHQQCDQEGCWGPGQNECLSCKHYKLDVNCVNNCTSTKSLGILSYDAGDRTCGKCHEECVSGCKGTSAKDCWRCKNFKDGPYCVEECPQHKYNDHNSCQECSKRCIDGCTGPLDRLGPRGCNVCDKFVLDSITNATIVASCLKPDEPCPAGYYQEYGAEVEDGHFMRALKGKPVCKKCHHKCKSCTGYGTHKDVCECSGYMANDQCEESCPRDFYADNVSRKCLRCSRECNGCFGPTEADCLNCRVYRIYYDFGPVALKSVSGKSDFKATTKQQGRFNCTSQCPIDKPHRISEGNLIDPYCAENPGPDPDNPRKEWLGPTAIFFIGIIVLSATIVCGSLYYCEYKKDKTAKLAMALSLGITDAEPLNHTGMKPNLAKLNSILTSELKQGPMLGEGVGGTVYQAVWCPLGTKDRRPVAMKILRDSGQQNKNKEFLDEAYIMMTVNHNNLVKLLGVCVTPEQLILVTPLMPLGCLRDYVEKNKHGITPKNLLEWGKQIANGMAYLEEHRMVHRDLALRNVLLQTPNRALISDFGLAKFLEVDQNEYQSLIQGKLPIKWLAPECFTDKTFTHKSDVWAFGVTIWELLTFGEKPFEECVPAEVPAAIKNGARLHQPSYVTAEVYKVMYSCWFYNPDDRPDFRSLYQDFVNFARDPERYLDWRPNGMCQDIGGHCSDDERLNNYDFDDNFSLNGNDDSSAPLTSDPALFDLISQQNRMNEMNGIEMRQHNSDSDAHCTNVSTPIVKKIGMFSNGSSQPLMAEDVFSRSSQQMSSKSSNGTFTDPNNNFMPSTNVINFNTNNQQNKHQTRQTSDSWWSAVEHTVSNNSLGKFEFKERIFCAFEFLQYDYWRLTLINHVIIC